jgi:Zinc knuckle
VDKRVTRSSPKVDKRVTRSSPKVDKRATRSSPKVDKRATRSSPRKMLVDLLETSLYGPNQYLAETVANNVENVLLSQVSLVDIENPDVVVKKRGRPAGARNKTSTKRDKSHFEHTECAYKCSNCGEPGHKKNKCPKPVLRKAK